MSMEPENGFADEGNKVRSLYQLEEVDLKRIPSSILTGLIRANTEDVPLHAEEMRPENADEIWILQCPETVQLGALIQGKKLFLDDRHQVFEEGERLFETVCVTRSKSERSGDVALLPDEAGKMQLVSFPVSGHITIKEMMDEIPDVVPLPSPKKVHQLPSGLKVRHPVYGTDYAIQEFPTPKRKKNKRKSDEAHVINHEVVEVYSEPVQTRESGQNSRKRKAQNEVETPIAEEIPRKKSKKRHSQIEPELIEIYEPEPEPRKKRRSHSSVLESDSEIEVILPRKRNMLINAESDEQSYIQKKLHSKKAELFIEPHPVSPSKKKRKKGPSSYSE